MTPAERIEYMRKRFPKLESKVESIETNQTDIVAAVTKRDVNEELSLLNTSVKSSSATETLTSDQ